MPGGISLAAFLDWQQNTGPIFLSGPNDIINNVSARSYVLGNFLRGKPYSEVLQGGNKIRETLFLKPSDTFEFFQRNQDVSFQNPQKDVGIELDWRFAWDHMAWDEAEYLLQTQGLGEGALKTKYKDMAKSKQQRCWQSSVSGLEAAIWYPPASTTTETDTYQSMEGRTGTAIRPYSIPVFVNEEQGGSGRFTSIWTTIENVNPTSYLDPVTGAELWDNQRVQYAASDPGDASGNGDGLFNALDEMSLKVAYKRPGIAPEHFEKEDRPNDSGHMICTSINGSKMIRRINRESNQSLIQPEDAAYPYPRFFGVPFVDVAALDTAALYHNGTTGFVSETAASVAHSGPRFYWLNGDYMKMIWHTGKYFFMHKARELQNKIGVFAMPVEMWCNLTCTSRRHQGIIYPL